MQQNKLVTFGIIAVVVGVGGAAIYGEMSKGLERRKGERELAAAIADCDKSDPDWRWAALNAKRTKVPAERNGEDRAKEVATELPVGWLTDEETQRVLQGAATTPPNAIPTAPILEGARRQHTKIGPAVNASRKFRDCPTGYREPTLPLPKGLELEKGEAREAALRLLGIDSFFAVERNDAARVIENLRAALNVSRSIGDDPFFRSQSVRCGLRQLAITQLERALGMQQNLPGLEQLQAEWAADADEPLLRYAIRGERAYYSDLTDKLAGEATAPEAKSLVDPEFARRFDTAKSRVSIPADHAAFLQWMTKAIAATKLPPEEQPAAFKGLPEVPGTPEFSLTSSRAQAVTSQAQEFWKSSAAMRCAVTGIACERFRQKNGQWPESLEALVPAFLPAVPNDPHDGKPLKYTKRADGVTISSAEKDISFRLWNREARHLPPSDAKAK